jgi:predicted transcriptional regulator
MTSYVIYPTEEQEKSIAAFLEAQEISFVKSDDDNLPEHVLIGIEQGKEDIKAGRYITLEEFKTRLASSK